MKIYFNKKHIKTVSNRFEPIKDQLPDLILYEEYKRVHKEEKEVFERALLAYYFEKEKVDLKLRQPSIYEWFKNSKPMQLVKIPRADWMLRFHDKKTCWVDKKNYPNVKYLDQSISADFEQLKMEMDE